MSYGHKINGIICDQLRNDTEFDFNIKGACIQTSLRVVGFAEESQVFLVNVLRDVQPVGLDQLLVLR